MDADVIVIGAGAVGASTAKHVAEAGHEVVVVEKEPAPAMHQSGRNSGVVHSGYNLKPGSNKAEYCVRGSEAMRAYCRDHGIPLDVGGVLVVARTEDEVGTLEELERRSRLNGVEARMVPGEGIPEVEPHAEGVAALHSPTVGSVDARAYVHRLVSDALEQGATFLFDTRVEAVEDPVAPEPGAYDGPGVRVVTSKGDVTARVVVNAAGLHADRVAGGLAEDVRVVPFRGYYAELKPSRRHLVRSHVYPAPDLAFPFLGVHLSRRVDGRVIVGPGAMLAFGREAYRFRDVNARDLGGTLAWPGFYRLFRDPRFRSLVRSEVRKSLSLRAVADEASILCPGVGPEDVAWSYAGNRAQLVSREGELVGDILVRSTDRAVHVLNAVSPGLTCSLPFGADLAEQAVERL